MDPDDFVLVATLGANLFAFFITMSIFWWVRKIRKDDTNFAHKKIDIE